MSDDKPPSTQLQQKGWMGRLSHFLTGGPKNRQDLLGFLKEAQQKKLMDSEAMSMIEGVLQVSEIRVREVMVPRSQMVVFGKDQTLTEVFPLVVTTAHSRFPVIKEDRSEVVGILLAKDLLKHIKDTESLKVDDIMRPARYIPESKRLNVLLREFRTNRNHMAIVVDEYGMTAGLVTIEDVLEQIVGEIEDEHDMDEDPFILKHGENEFTIKAITPIDEFNEYFSTQLEDVEFDTIGGFIVSQLEKMPQKGEKVKYENFSFEVLSADSRRVEMLKLKIIDARSVK